MSPDGARELLARVASSPQFLKSKRLRELLLYLGDRSLQDPNCILREQEIGVDVLGRPPDYDTSHDTLVRVQVSQLRKKLQEYFAGDGCDEYLIIEIPKGSYVPVFRPRAAGDAEKVSPAPSRRPGRVLWGSAAAVLVVIVAATLASRGQASHDSRRPGVDAFWTQLFGNRLQTYLVLSDVTLIEFEKLAGGPVRISEYEAKEFDRLAGERIADPVTRALAREFVNRVTTSVSDVHVASEAAVLSSERHFPLNVLSARDFSSSLLASQNAILLGSRRANPWVGLFEDQMSFRTDYQENPPGVQFINVSPRPGEQPVYRAEWRNHGYCRVAFLSNPRRTGNVLVISGSDVISTEAGGRFVTTEDSLRLLRRQLGLSGGPLPHFEVLLRTQVVNSTIPSYDLVAWRPRT